MYGPPFAPRPEPTNSLDEAIRQLQEGTRAPANSRGGSATRPIQKPKFSPTLNRLLNGPPILPRIAPPQPLERINPFDDTNRRLEKIRQSQLFSNFVGKLGGKDSRLAFTGWKQEPELYQFEAPPQSPDYLSATPPSTGVGRTFTPESTETGYNTAGPHPGYGPAPERNFRKEARSGLLGSGIAALLGALFNGTEGAMSAGAGYGQGFQQGAEQQFAERLRQFQEHKQKVDREYANSVQFANDENAARAERNRGITERNQNAFLLFQGMTNDRNRTEDQQRDDAKQQTQAYMGIVDILRQMPDESRQGYINSLDASGALKNLGISGMFPRRPNGTFDLGFLGQTNTPQANAPDPKERQKILNSYLNGAWTNHGRAAALFKKFNEKPTTLEESEARKNELLKIIERAELDMAYIADTAPKAEYDPVRRQYLPPTKVQSTKWELDVRKAWKAQQQLIASANLQLEELWRMQEAARVAATRSRSRSAVSGARKR